MSDGAWLRRCVELARRGEGRTSPNPAVGCVIVGGDGRVLAEGWHLGVGTPHAEADALAKLGGRAEGATIYTSLEPCAHASARKPIACADLCIQAGPRRVVYGLADPVPGHDGGGARIRAAGIQVTGPVPETEAACRRVIEPFLHFHTHGRAHVTLKAATTLDGRIATRTGESQWITGDAARADVHQLRDRLDAVLVGAGTALADDPRLTTRGVDGGRNPVRVVLDGRLRIPDSLGMLREPGRTIVVCGASAPERTLPGAEIWRAPADPVSLAWLTAELGARGLLSLLVEGGGETHAGFLSAGLCDRLILYVAPLALGGPSGWVGGPGFAHLAAAPRFHFEGEPVRIGEDLRLSFTPRPPVLSLP